MTTAQIATRSPGSPVRAAATASLAVGLVSAAVSTAAGGPRGLVGAVLGVLVVGGFFGFGQVVLSTLRDVEPSMLLVVALLSYLLQVVVLLALFAAFQRHPAWADIASPTAFGVTILGCTLAWTTGLVIASRRQRVPLYDLGPDVEDDGGGDRS